MPYEELIKTSWKLYEIAIITAEILGWMGIIIGAIGYGMTKTNPAKHRRYRGMLFGGAAGLASVLLTGKVYRAITFTMIGKVNSINHDTAMYPQQFLDTFSGPLFDAVAIAGILSQVAAVIGMAAFSFGTGFWGISKRRSIFHTKAVRIIYAGIALMVMSVCERIFAAAAYIFIDILS
ncbi:MULTISPECIES: hypothetical protein [unclassified Haloarcula]|uniref:hypothetical protein n=1 Tax=Haloarcula sp. K1 TaxID=1622207 RepID=UPI0007BB68EA|nr:hypothetical protein [Haloarcula sp. K1]KZX46250.1 hypothetical protein AV929_15880 [Haloarcula sp. K1]